MMTTRRQVLGGLAALPVVGCSSGGNGSGEIVAPTPTPTPPPTPPAPARSDTLFATKDGSIGQTYSAPSGMIGIQWYREALTSDRTRTAIPGATGASYAAQAADSGYRLAARGTVAGADVDARALAVVLPPPILLEGFDSLAGLAARNEAIVASETTGQVQGSARLRVQGTGANGSGPGLEKADIGTHDPTGFGTIAQFVDLGWDPVYQSVTGFELAFTRGGARYESSQPILAPLYQTPQPLFYGTMWASQHVSEIAGLATIGSGPLGLINTFNTQAPHAPSVAVDALLARAGGRPTVIFGFDDVFETQYSIAFAYMRARGLKGGVHLAPDNIGVAGRLSRSQLLEMYAAGWDCYLNGTADDGALTGKGSIEAALDNVRRVRDWAVAAGMPRGNEFLCYPNGTYQNSPARPLVQAVTTDGSAVATMPSTEGIVVGMVAGGYAVPAGTTVVGVDSATQIRLSNPVRAQTRPFSFSDLSGAFSYTKLPLALKAAGYRMARTTQNRGSWLSRFGIPDRGGILTPGNATSNETIEEMRGQIDLAILRGETIEFYTHSISAAGGVQTNPEKFQALIDYVTEKRDAGLLDVLTKTELWARDGGSAVPV